MNQPSLFEGARMTLPEAMERSFDALNLRGREFDHWVICWSMGKDSTGLLTLIAYGLETGKIRRPKSITAVCSDTKMENPALMECAREIMSELPEYGIDMRIVYPKLDHRFFVYMLGRGVPPPTNSFRWCTDKLKARPMQKPVEEIYECAYAAAEKHITIRCLCGGQSEGWITENKNIAAHKRDFRRSHKGDDHKFKIALRPGLLVLTGVRQGESAVRDQRIALSCSRDGGECGQGWYQESLDGGISSTLAPILHWRQCHIEAWLMKHTDLHGFKTRLIGAAYGGDDSDMSTRTGCNGCNLVAEDRMLELTIRQPGWGHISPLRRLRPLYAHLRESSNRLCHTQKTNPDRAGQLGPLTMDARLFGLAQVLDIQREINDAARAASRPGIGLIDDEEKARILELIEANTWPEGWNGTEPVGNEVLDKLYSSGVVQPHFTDLIRL